MRGSAFRFLHPHELLHARCIMSRKPTVLSLLGEAQPTRFTRVAPDLHIGIGLATDV